MDGSSFDHQCRKKARSFSQRKSLKQFSLRPVMVTGDGTFYRDVTVAQLKTKIKHLSSVLHIKMHYVPPMSFIGKLKSKNLRVLALDMGPKYMGLALSDSKLVYSYGLTTCEMGKYPTPIKLGEYLAEIVLDNDVGGLAVGYSAHPKHIHKPRHGAMVLSILHRLFLSGCLGSLPFTFIDESFTTEIAKKYVAKYFPDVTDYHARKKLLDEVEAWFAVDRWLEIANKGKLYSGSSIQRQQFMEKIGIKWNLAYKG